MQDSVVSFPKVQDATSSIINPQIQKICPKKEALCINVSSVVQDYVRYPSFVHGYTAHDLMASSTERMEKVYERVTAFLQKSHDEDMVF